MNNRKPDKTENPTGSTSGESQGGVRFEKQVGNISGSNIAGRDINIYPARPEPDLEEAKALLASLPTDHVPAPDRFSLPPGSRPGLDLDPNFTGREAELRKLAAELKEGHAVAIGQPVAVSGLGGMGKSSLASAFVYRYGRYFAGGVCWLSFADPASIPAEIADAGSRLDLPGFHALDLPDKVAATRRAWESPLPRLLIFDNCEDEKLVDEYKPTTGGCRVLTTSRSAIWTPSRGLHHLHLDTLRRPDSIAFLRKLAPRLTGDEAGSIAGELGDFPLALHLAGSYLARYNRVSPTSYLKGLQKRNPLEHASLQGRGSTYNPTRHERHVHKTFLLSFDRLDAADSIDCLARDLLVRAACFAPGEPFAHDLLLATLPADDEMEPEYHEDALQRLLALGLLDPAGESSVRLHRLLAAFVALLGIDDAVHRAVEHALDYEVRRIGWNALPGFFATILPHLHYAVAIASARAEDTHAATLSETLAYLLRAHGDYAAARPLYERALAIREAVLGPDHPATAQSLNNLAYLLEAQGDYATARPLYERALAIVDKTLGAEHQITATSLNNLASLLRAQGDYAAAGPLYERALAIQEKTLGPEHPDTAAGLSNLALLLTEQGYYATARPLHERALAIVEKTLGPEHPDTASSLNNLAVLLRAAGDYAAARPLYERALSIRERALGPEHPATANSLNNLAGLLESLDDYANARPLYERALAILEKTLGPKHPDTGISAGNLAGVLQAQGDYEIAKSLRQRALAIHEQTLGPEHPVTGTSLNNLASLLQSQGDYAAARPLYERALAIREQTLWSDHPDTATSLNNLAALLDTQGDYAAALPLYERALAIIEQAFGLDHPSTATSLNNLAALLHAQGDYDAALPLYERALAIREQALGPDHPDTAQSLNNLAGLLDSQGDYAAALPLYERALAILEKSLGPDHPNTRLLRGNLDDLNTRIEGK